MSNFIIRRICMKLPRSELGVSHFLTCYAICRAIHCLMPILGVTYSKLNGTYGGSIIKQKTRHFWGNLLWTIWIIHLHHYYNNLLRFYLISIDFSAECQQCHHEVRGIQCCKKFILQCVICHISVKGRCTSL